MTDLVSVIVPVYKVEKYLRACVDSILSQSYERLEIILVDDGSPDDCGSICDAYQEQDYRVRVIHKKNGGLSDARNAGLEIASGEWVTFVDSDDVLHGQFVEVLYMLAKTNQADLAACSFQKFTDVFAAGQECDLDGDDGKYQSLVLGTEAALTHLLYQTPPLETSAHSKLYRRRLFDDVKYPVGLYYEDLATTYRILMKSGRIVITQQCLYGYRIRQTSIMHENASPKMLSCIPISRQLYEEVSKAYPNLKRAAASRAFSANRGIYLQMLHEQKKERRAVWREIRKYRSIVLRDADARKRERLMALLSYMGPEVMHLLSGLYKKQQNATYD